MTKRKKQKILGFVIGAAMGAALWMNPLVGKAVTKEEKPVEAIEKIMLSASTKKIEYKKGKIKSVVSSRWKNAKRMLRSAKALDIKKKGWYSFLITEGAGTRQTVQIYLQKKKYVFAANVPVKPKEGYCLLVPKEDSQKAATVEGASLKKGGNLIAKAQMDQAGFVWKIESAGGTKFRLKNVNSGYYFSDMGTNGTKANAAQKLGVPKDDTQVFRMYSAGAGYFYVKCVGTKRYLHMDGKNLEFLPRKRNKSFYFQAKMKSCPASFVSITDGRYPSALEEGVAFSLAGMVTSRYSIKTITVSVVDEKGETKLSHTAKVNGYSYNIKDSDAAITFGKLPAGKYEYRISVKDTTGKTKTWLKHPFAVEKKITELRPVGTPESATLSYNVKLIEAVGHQSTGSALEKKACASFALAYCNAILNGSSANPSGYWLSSTDVSCVWGKGGYQCSASGYGSELAVLQRAYKEILAGRPSILHVTGNTEQHWLCIIGYKNVSSLQKLTASNFLAIDPWNGNVITVSSKYKIKNTYRLATKI